MTRGVRESSDLLRQDGGARRNRAAFALTLAIVSCSACGSRDEPNQKPLTAVRVVVVAAEAGESAIRYTASIEPNSRVEVAFKVPGYVDDLLRIDGRLVQQGDRVQLGTRLARVSEADYVERVNQARSQLEEALAAGEQARQALERATQLYASKSLVKPDLESAQAAAEVTQAKIRGARAQLQEAENALADCVLKAPLGGVVLQRLVELGTLVAPGSPGFVIADTAAVKAVFGAPDVMVRQIAVGSQQVLNSAALPGGDFRGSVTRIASVIDPKSNVFDVEVTIPNRDDQLKVGMVVTLQVAATAPAPVSVAIPITAVIRSDRASGYAVFMLDEEGGKQIARLRPVTLGTVLGNRITVTKGLVVGERVILNSAGLVTDGEQVRIVS